MCVRHDSMNAVREAAEALRAACTELCMSPTGKTLREIYRETAKDATPADLLALLGRMQ